MQCILCMACTNLIIFNPSLESHTFCMHVQPQALDRNNLYQDENITFRKFQDVPADLRVSEFLKKITSAMLGNFTTIELWAIFLVLVPS